MKAPVFNSLIILLLAIFSTTAMANEVKILDVKAHQKSDKSWVFAVTLAHKDTGWEHYANEWQVTSIDKKVLATRTLHHPHVTEQPFTRNISGVNIPTTMKSVRIIAKDSLHGISKKAIEVNLETKKLTPVNLD